MRTMNKFQFTVACLVLTLAACLSWGVTESFATLNFYPTTDDASASHWLVSANVSGNDGNPVFLTGSSDFGPAYRRNGNSDWIANNVSGNNGGVGNYTFFVFRQTFDLTGYNPATASLSFQWAADDSGQGYAQRGSWRPEFSLNGETPIYWGPPGAYTYDYGSTVTLTSGFVSGINTINFYIEGNGQTDGLMLRDARLTANPVPVPAGILLLAPGLVGLAAVRRRFKK